MISYSMAADCLSSCIFIFFFFFFKQKTAYEMLRSLVGSEMCIRDRPGPDGRSAAGGDGHRPVSRAGLPGGDGPGPSRSGQCAAECGAGRAEYPVSYTHLRAHETPEHLVCRLLLEKKKN